MGRVWRFGKGAPGDAKGEEEVESTIRSHSLSLCSGKSSFLKDGSIAAETGGNGLLREWARDSTVSKVESGTPHRNLQGRKSLSPRFDKGTVVQEKSTGKDLRVNQAKGGIPLSSKMQHSRGRSFHAIFNGAPKSPMRSVSSSISLSPHRQGGFRTRIASKKAGGGSGSFRMRPGGTTINQRHDGWKDGVNAADFPGGLTSPKRQLVMKGLKEREGEFTSVKDIQIFCGTWNVNAKKPDRENPDWLSAWLCPEVVEEHRSPHDGSVVRNGSPVAG
ncbi:unnamed protein product, partial [Choristocarpus tenellus]